MATNFLYELMGARCSALSISKRDLVTRAGFANTAKGLRRLERIESFDFESSRHLIDKLPMAIDVAQADVNRAREQSINALRDEREENWRRGFRPFALVRTGKRGCPRQISLAAFCNAGQYVNTYFDKNTLPDAYVRTAVAAFKSNKEDISKFYYTPENIVINYSPDRAVLYTLDGEFLEEMGGATKPASLTVTFR